MLEYEHKLQAYRTQTLESEFCMGGQILTDNLLYKIFIPAFEFHMPVTCTSIIKVA